MTWQSGGGGGLPSGVAGDGLTPGGLNIAGGLVAGNTAPAAVPSFFYLQGFTYLQDTPGGIAEGDPTCYIAQTTPVTLAGTGAQAVSIYRGGSIAAADYSSPTIDVNDSTGSSQDLLHLTKLSGSGNALNVAGPAVFSGVIGEHGKVGAAAPTAITGTITAATLTQLTAIVLELLQALDTKGSIVNSTT